MAKKRRHQHATPKPQRQSMTEEQNSSPVEPANEQPVEETVVADPGAHQEDTAQTIMESASEDTTEPESKTGTDANEEVEDERADESMDSGKEGDEAADDDFWKDVEAEQTDRPTNEVAPTPSTTNRSTKMTAPAFLRQRHFWYSVAGVIAVLFVAILLWWQWERSWVGVVDGHYITTTNLDQQLEATYGTQVLPQVIQQELILQEAARKHVTPSTADVDKELKNFKDSVGGDEAYKSALKSYNVSEQILRDRIKVRLALEALLKDKLTVSDKEVQDYYTSNKADVDPDNKGLDSVKASIVSTLKDQKLQQESDSYVSGLQQKAHVTSQLGNSRLTLGDFLHDNIGQPITDLWNGLMSLGKKK